MRLPLPSRVLLLTVITALCGAAAIPGFTQTTAISPALTPHVVPPAATATATAATSSALSAFSVNWSYILLYLPMMLQGVLLLSAAVLFYRGFKSRGGSRLKTLLLAAGITLVGLITPTLFAIPDLLNSGCGGF